ncbi:adenylosuccinate lyase [Chitinophaga costaii]|uniref:Adenylosuccinate lyase n=1 Tax=Chitinophaga costaii TaxID=1335309 RepID=A0A1C4FG10_9BACT|nr:adenylosuccinate lyase [Chitinophaga costaii]PUZ20134.1 adenylosuccinate lyase [Chitinophaga costaii]SCC54836.1 adenylosuccinate lyase [Chitinophaga costaii]
MELQALTAISPLDGRYRKQLEELAPYFSEYALIRYRVLVEVEYFIALAGQGIFPLAENLHAPLRRIYQEFTLANAQTIKDTEKITNHDVKAVEYFLKDQLKALDLADRLEWVHFGLTSQDINNTAIPLLWKEALHTSYLPGVTHLVQSLENRSQSWMHVPMLARTHGQPASPTILGKEMAVFVERLQGQLKLLREVPFAAKFGGATGNFNAHHVAFPHIDWVIFGNHFVNEVLGLQRMQFTTQIEHYDHLAAQFDGLKRINTILLDLCKDIWQYISMDYFKQQIKKDEVGSSAMPHKVNPIDFENAEGNLGIGNALYEHLSAKLPISRLQRDLTDSTVLRNIGVPLGHSLLALKSIEKGLGKLILNESKIAADLENNWAVVAEAIQTVLRRESYPQPYEALKALTRGGVINADTIRNFIEGLQVSDDVKAELLAINPSNYTGIFG